MNIEIAKFVDILSFVQEYTLKFSNLKSVFEINFEGITNIS